MKKYYLIGIPLGIMLGVIVPTLAFASDIFDVTDYILFDYLPHLAIPFLLGMIIMGLITRFVRSGLNL